MQDPDVEYAVYNIDHPLTGKPEMTIKTKRGKRPRIALKQAAEELQKESSDFKKLIDEALQLPYYFYSDWMAEYKIPSLTTDVFIFDDDFNFILIKRKNNPYKDYWALPGGFVEYGESVENAAIREAKEETNIDVELKELVNVYSEPNRDPRGHTITIAYIAKGNINNRKADSDAKEIGIFSLEKLNEINIAFDHEKIIKDCLNKAKSSF